MTDKMIRIERAASGPTEASPARRPGPRKPATYKSEPGWPGDRQASKPAQPDKPAATLKPAAPPEKLNKKKKARLKAALAETGG